MLSDILTVVNKKIALDFKIFFLNFNPMDYFFNEHFEDSSNLTHCKNLITELLEDRNYKHLGYLYHLEKEKHSYLFGIILSEMFYGYEQTFNSLEELMQTILITITTNELMSS